MRGRALATRDDLHVVLVSPEIPWNTGNAGRTCLAAGAPRLWPDWESFEQALPELGEALFFSAESERPLWDAPTSSRTVLVFGRESVGLPQAVRERWRERMVGFPMADPELRSLNLSTCVALALYEVLRRRAARAG